MKKNITTLFCCLVILFVLNFVTSISESPMSLTASLKKTEEPIKQPEPEKPPLELEAVSACAYDMTNQEFIFEKEANKQLPLASVTKLMTALVAKENLPTNTLVEIPKEAIMQEGDSGLAIGSAWKLTNILSAMLIASSNDAAFAVGATIRETEEPTIDKFVDLMNLKASELGLDQTQYLNTSGLDLSEEQAGALGSCKDMAKLITYILSNHPELIEITTQESFEINGLKFENTNKILSELPCLFGGKTGFSDLAGGNLIIAVDKGLNHPMILGVFGSSIDGRFEDVKKLYDRYIK